MDIRLIINSTEPAGHKVSDESTPKSFSSEATLVAGGHHANTDAMQAAVYASSLAIDQAYDYATAMVDHGMCLLRS
ncbi:hypothetical protein GGI10_005466, partial [Coemansia sp. RSA 2530]